MRLAIRAHNVGLDDQVDPRRAIEHVIDEWRKDVAMRDCRDLDRSCGGQKIKELRALRWCSTSVVLVWCGGRIPPHGSKKST